MPFREVGVFEVREVLRLWVRGTSLRAISRLTGLDRKTVRRYVEAGRDAGVWRGGGEDQLTEGVVGQVIGGVHPRGPEAHGDAWRLCVENRESLRGWVEEGLRLTKVQELLRRQTGEAVPYRTLHRFAVEELSFGKRRVTVRVEDGKPGEELQVDFGQMGRIREQGAGAARVIYGLIFTACFSRHQFVWLSFTQALEEVIEGFEQAWEFFGGVFRVVILDNLKAAVVKADACAPRINEKFLEYAQARGFVIDPARVRRPQDKPRVERQVSYVRGSFFAGEEFVSLAEARERAELWCRNVAGTRIHGTTRQRPAEVFEREEKGKLLPAPQSHYEIPQHAEVTVWPDHHIRVARALYSLPTAYIGEKVSVWADRQLVKVFFKGELIKTHPRQLPGGRSTDPKDYPKEKAIYAMRDAVSLEELARQAGEHIGIYAQRLLEGPLPWSRLRHVYRLLGLVRRYGQGRVEKACERALSCDVVEVTRIARMLERALEEGDPPIPPRPPAGRLVPLRFARPVEEFSLAKAEESKEVSSDEHC